MSMSVKGEFTCQIMSSLRTAQPSTPTPPAHSPTQLQPVLQARTMIYSRGPSLDFVLCLSLCCMPAKQLSIYTASILPLLPQI